LRGAPESGRRGGSQDRRRSARFFFPEICQQGRTDTFSAACDRNVAHPMNSRLIAFPSGSGLSETGGTKKSLAIILRSDHGHFMEMTITQFKAKCLGVVERVQREKVSVIISRHGHPAARLVPVDVMAGDTRLFGRSADQTRISGDILSMGEDWDACR